MGQAVITLAKLRGLNTINLIRNRCVVSFILKTLSDPTFDRENFSDVEQYLKSLGATHVIAYDELEDKSISERVKGWTGGKVCTDVAPWFHPLTVL